MIAFLKRRWILLSCAVVLLVCSTLTYRRHIYFEHLFIDFAVIDGEIQFNTISGSDFPEPIIPWIEFPDDAKRPLFKFDGSLALDFNDTDSHVRIPVWLPLFVIPFLIATREVFWWRRKRTKVNTADSIPSHS